MRHVTKNHNQTRFFLLFCLAHTLAVASKRLDGWVVNTTHANSQFGMLVCSTDFRWYWCVLNKIAHQVNCLLTFPFARVDLLRREVFCRCDNRTFHTMNNQMAKERTTNFVFVSQMKKKNRCKSNRRNKNECQMEKCDEERKI